MDRQSDFLLFLPIHLHNEKYPKITKNREFEMK